MLEERVTVLTGALAGLQKEILELRRAVAEPRLRVLVENTLAGRMQEISTLADHATKALRLLIDTGTITQEQANEAIR
jgi:hypothetical protein